MVRLHIGSDRNTMAADRRAVIDIVDRRLEGRSWGKEQHDEEGMVVLVEHIVGEMMEEQDRRMGEMAGRKAEVAEVKMGVDGNWRDLEVVDRT